MQQLWGTTLAKKIHLGPHATGPAFSLAYQHPVSITSSFQDSLVIFPRSETAYPPLVAQAASPC